MSTDIQDAIDRSFGTGPAQPTLETQLITARRALRRRRVLATTVTAGVVLVAGASYAVGASGPGVRTGSEVASNPTPTATRPASTPDDAPWPRGEKVRYLDGELQVREGVTVHEHLENPFGYEAPFTSDGFDLSFRGTRTWVLVERDQTGTSLTESTPSNGWASFGDWVADQVAAAQGGQHGSGWPDTMRLADDGTVAPVPGAEVLQRTDDPRLGDSFAPAGATTGAALVDVGGRPSTFFVVWRVVDGELDVITTPPRDVVGATWDELLTYARAQYASGEGLR